MKIHAGELRSSASDLVGYLNCRHLTQLELQVAHGALGRPMPWDPSLEALWERGFRHERDYIEQLATANRGVARIAGVDIDDASVAATLEAMRSGVHVIVQGALRATGWVGRADVLQRVDKRSALGDWSYEVYDTKLARETKANTILQLCLYSDLLSVMQGVAPDRMHVVAPWTDFVPQTYRVAEYAAYYRLIRQGFIAVTAAAAPTETYPTPTGHCDICAWRTPCRERRRADDHLSLVAGISSLQITELKSNGVESLSALAAMPLPLQWRPERGSKLSYVRIREQARLQLATRDLGVLQFEAIPAEPGFGLSALPAPSASDIYLDFEGDAFVGEHGQEYLLGYHYRELAGEEKYVGLWGMTREEEKQAFVHFIDFVIARWQSDPSLHIYHYGAYEPSALKRLMGRYATREDELDRILRGKLLVDLLTVVRQGVRVGVESYSIKRLEPLYGYERKTDLPDANLALTRLQTGLELGDLQDISSGDFEAIESYNRDDCVSTRYLHRWLEHQRDALIARGLELARPSPADDAPGENTAAWVARITPLVEALTVGVPADAAERSAEEHGKWLLANLLDFHRREDKATWWEYFRLAALPAEDLLEDKAGLGALTFVDTVGGTTKCPVHRYAFLLQETDARPGKGLRSAGGEPLGEIQAIDAEHLTVDIKKRQSAAAVHPQAVFVHEHVDPKPMKEALVRLAEFVIENGLVGDGDHRAERDLLLRKPPGFAVDGSIKAAGESAFDAALRLANVIELGVLPIQGPPGAGKTFTGSRMIVELVRRGRRVGVVANSHAVIRNLIDEVIKTAEQQRADLTCVLKPSDPEPDGPRLQIVKSSDALLAALASGCRVAGATAWHWSTPGARASVDVLFVDEAAQMSLANVLAVSQAARAVVLLGDPRQLDQPMQGSHPEGTDRSALDHLLDGEQTIGTHQGLFLEETWRLHPSICAFTSELFYEDKLHSRAGLERQAVVGGPGAGSGLRYLPVPHVGNTNCSPEEASVVSDLVRNILASGATWIDQNGDERRILLADILIIAPYNGKRHAEAAWTRSR